MSYYDEKLSNKVKKNDLMLFMVAGTIASLLIPPMYLSDNFLCGGLVWITITGLLGVILNPVILISEYTEDSHDYPFVFNSPISYIVSYVTMVVLQYKFNYFSFSNVWLIYLGFYILSFLVFKIVLFIVIKCVWFLIDFDPDDIIEYIKRPKKDNVYNMGDDK